MKRFYVSKPYFRGLDLLGLKYVDVLTYVAIKSFNNHKDQSCFPAYGSIAALMKASKSFVMESTKRLVKSGLLSKYRRYYASNKYFFRSSDRLSKIPVEVLKLDLTMHEKAMLIVLRQFAETEPNQVRRDIKDMATEMGVTYKTVYTQVQALINKGYLVEKPYRKNKWYELTDMVDWFFEWDTRVALKSPESMVLIIG